MMVRRAVLSLVVVTAALAACSKKPPPAQPTPTQMPDTVGQGQRALDAARADSIRRAREAEEAARRAAAAAGAEARGVLEETVYFDYDEARLRSDAEGILSRKLAVLRANPTVAIRITGHADERGSLEYNLALGMRRANAVRDYLANFGIDATRFTTETMGEDQPADPGHNESAWARNRRTEFEITRGGENLTMPGR